MVGSVENDPKRKRIIRVFQHNIIITLTRKNTHTILYFIYSYYIPISGHGERCTGFPIKTILSPSNYRNIRSCGPRGVHVRGLRIINVREGRNTLNCICSRRLCQNRYNHEYILRSSRDDSCVRIAYLTIISDVISS